MICENWRVHFWPVTWELTLGFDRLKTTPDRSSLAAGCTTTLNMVGEISQRNLEICSQMPALMQLKVRLVVKSHRFLALLINQFSLQLNEITNIKDHKPSRALEQ